jgi:aldehyde dehydrogenase (NAD+)
MPNSSLAGEVRDIARALSVADADLTGGQRIVRSPIDGGEIGRVRETSTSSVDQIVARAAAAQMVWRNVPAPRRGELVRRFGDALRAEKERLGRLVTIENGKILQEGFGEVQEMIDICEFAVGLSRQLYGLTIASERPGHRLMETWHPLGICGIITAFNFPVAVWAWNAALALVCGNTLVWKPSEKTPITALATQALFQRTVAAFDPALRDISQVIIGDAAVANALVEDRRVALVSATGSTRMGCAVAPKLANRFARALLELGGNNGAILCPSADQELALRAVTFAAVGTAGQRCTSLRRLFVHEELYAGFVPRLGSVYAKLRIGDPRESATLVGPLIDGAAYAGMRAALDQAQKDGGKVVGGERVLSNEWPQAFYVRPALVEMPAQTEIVTRETFAPILYVLRYRDLPEAIRLHNAVPQGLASSIFTSDMREAETFMSAEGSDCGIVNVNIGPSGAEIGGAFGGEKETGGGRESGSDAWKAYMRRATNTINYSRDLPLAQGIRFEV